MKTWSRNWILQRLARELQRPAREFVVEGLLPTDLAGDALPGILDRQAAERAVEIVGRLVELALFHRLVDVDRLLVHHPRCRHQDDQEAAVIEAHELQMAEDRRGEARHDDDARIPGDIRQGATGALQLILDRQNAVTISLLDSLSPLDAQRAELEQGLDVIPVGFAGRDASGRGMRGNQVAHLLELRHDVTHCGGRDAEPGAPGDRSRPYRFGGLDMPGDYRLENLAIACTQLLCHDPFLSPKKAQAGRPALKILSTLASLLPRRKQHNNAPGVCQGRPSGRFSA